jgi:hypothetical protein
MISFNFSNILSSFEDKEDFTYLNENSSESSNSSSGDLESEIACNILLEKSSILSSNSFLAMITAVLQQSSQSYDSCSYENGLQYSAKSLVISSTS